MLNFITSHATDLLSFCGAVSLGLAYQRYLGWRTRRDPASSAQDVMLAARAAWGVEGKQIKHVEAQLNRAGIYYRIGMRAYYFTVPLLFWLFGPLWLLGATLAVVFFMFHLDRAPKHDTDLMG